MSDFTIIIPSYNGLQQLKRWFGVCYPLKDKVLVVDSGSNDGTVEYLNEIKVRYLTIPQVEFNHGATREFARKQTDAKAVVYMTQDAIPKRVEAIECLAGHVISGDVDIAYGRQISRSGASIFESFPRKFNYPQIDNQRTLQDVDKYGAYTFFCSDSFAAYSQQSLDKVGGFKSWYTNEDYLITAKILRNGGKIMYVSNAEVVHSHSYTLVEEFKRNFDNGHIRGLNPWIRDLVGSAEKRGMKFFRKLVNELWKNSAHLVPYAFVQTGVKWLGFKMGYHSTNWPKAVKKFCSGQSYYFDSPYYPSENRDQNG